MNLLGEETKTVLTYSLLQPSWSRIENQLVKKMMSNLLQPSWSRVEKGKDDNESSWRRDEYSMNPVRELRGRHNDTWCNEIELSPLHRSKVHCHVPR